jgi:hypothetical protein
MAGEAPIPRVMAAPLNYNRSTNKGGKSRNIGEKKQEMRPMTSTEPEKATDFTIAQFRNPSEIATLRRGRKRERTKTEIVTIEQHFM